MTFCDTYQHAITESLLTLTRVLRVDATPDDDSTHSVVEITGWQDNEALRALAVYLVALRASVIDQAGRVCCELIGDARDFARDLLRSVEDIVVQPDDSQESSSDWKSKWRNPWIAEGMWHCCMCVAMGRNDLHPIGSVIAVDFSHVSPKDHGLDVTALYVKENGTLGMSFVETKAYCNEPNAAISDAVVMFKAIESGVHDTRLRQLVTAFRSILGEPYCRQLSFTLWKDERTLIPNPHYEVVGATVQWGRRRPSFAGLAAPVIIMPHGVNDFAGFFDRVADEMLQMARGVAGYV